MPASGAYILMATSISPSGRYNLVTKDPKGMTSA